MLLRTVWQSIRAQTWTFWFMDFNQPAVMLKRAAFPRIYRQSHWYIAMLR